MRFVSMHLSHSLSGARRNFARQAGMAAAGTALLGALALVPGSAAHAQTTVQASNDATIRPGGPRSGTGGKTFFNAEGSSQGTNASFAVADFTTTPQSGKAVTSASLQLTEANQTFSTPGTVDIYLVSNVSASIEPGTSSLIFDTTQAPDGLGSQLGTKYLIGTYSYGTTGNTNNGQNDSISLDLTDVHAQTLFMAEVAAGKLRFAVTPGDNAVVSTFAGYNNTTYTSSVVLNYTILGSGTSAPESSSLALMLSSLPGALGFGIARRRHRHRCIL